MSEQTSDDWERQRAFLAVLEEGSLSAAARRLGLMQPTVRRRLDELEQRVGEALFVRSPSGLTPTPLALQLGDPARAMAAAAAAFDRAASSRDDAASGHVRISASEVIGVEVLPAILAESMRRHPGLVLSVATSNRLEDLLHRQADIAVRMVRPAQDALVAKAVGRIELGLFAHPRVIAAHGTPASVEDLARFPLVGPETETPGLRALRAQRLPLDVADLRYRADSDVAQLAAIRAGVGIGVAQAALAGDLVRVLPSVVFGLDTWIVMHEDQRRVRRVRLVFDRLAEALAAYAARRA